MLDEIIRNSISTFFAILQALVLLMISGAFKMYWDVKKLKRDLNAAHKLIRELKQEIENLKFELRVKRDQETLESSTNCGRESETQ